MRDKGERMKRVGIVAVAVAIGIVICVSGCRKEDTPEKKATEEMKKAEPKYDNSIKETEGIKNAIRGYNQAVIHGNLKEAYLKFIKKYATEYEGSRVVIFVTEDRMKKRVMRSKLSELIFDNISSLNDKAVVDTREEWEFDYIDLDTGKLKEPAKVMSYKLRYTLIWEDNRWLVGKLEQLKEPEITVYSPPRAME